MPKVNTIQLFSQKQSPKDYDRRKKVAQALMESGGDKPVAQNFAQGLAIVAPKIIGGFLDKQADDNEEREEQEASDTMMKAFTGGLDSDSMASPLSSSGGDWSGESETSSTTRRGGSGGASRSAAANERKQRAIARLTEKGYTPHAAEGIADNLFDESAFNTKAVGDNGTAFGIAQWRGPRFQNLKKFAASKGTDWHDFDTQVDFVDHEMRTGSDPGAGIAFAKLQRAGDKDEAYNHFVTHYERPSKAMLQKRLRQVQRDVTEGNYGRGGYDDDGPPVPQIDTGVYDQQIQAGLTMMRNPRTRDAGYRLYQQGTQGKASARMKQAELGYGAQKDAYTRRQQRMDKLEDRDWEIERDDIKADRERKNKTYQLSPGQRVVDADGNVIAEGPPKTDADIEVGADGSIRMKTGKLTEVQSKDIGFFNRGAAAEIDLRDREEALIDFRSKNGGNVPLVGNYLKSPEYRAAEVPARQFLAAILRKDTGAAVTDREFELYGNMFLPVPGDDAETMAAKRRARAIALKSIRTGLGTAEALADAYPELFDRKSLEPKPRQKPTQGGGKQPVEQPPPGISEEDRKLWPYMSKEDRDLLRKHYGGA